MIQGFALPPPGPFILQGGLAKTLLTGINLNDDAYILSGTTNPTVTPVDAPESSLYLRATGSGGQLFIKNDDGSTTNWTAFSTGSSNSFTDFQGDTGTTVVPEIASDTITFTSTDSSVDIESNGATDQMRFTNAGKLVGTGTWGSPTLISTAITTPSQQRAVMFLAGNGGPVTNPTISVGATLRELFLVGTNDTDYIDLDNTVANLLLNGGIRLKSGTILHLLWVATLGAWVEVTRNGL